MYIYQKLPSLIRCNVQLIFKPSKTGLNLEFLFSETSCLIQDLQKWQSMLFTDSQGKGTYIAALPKDVSVKWYAHCLVQDLNTGLQFHFVCW